LPREQKYGEVRNIVGLKKQGGAFHHAKPTCQRKVGIPGENGTAFSD